MTTPTTAGWYDDPQDSNALRYWDGHDWTVHRERKAASRPNPAPVVPAPPQQAPPPLTAPPPTPPVAPSPPPGQQPQWSPPSQPPGAKPSRGPAIPLLIMAAVGLVVALGAAAVLVFAFVLTDNKRSPEDQIRGVLNAYANAINNADPVAVNAVFCDQVNNNTSNKTSDELRAQRIEKGTVTISATNIHVTGDRATATIASAWSKSPSDSGTSSVSFVNERGSWKLCGDAG